MKVIDRALVTASDESLEKRSANPPPKPPSIQKHVLGTYFTLRLGLGVLAVAFPLVLVIGGKLWADLDLQDSMSRYYHATRSGRSMRDWFVGILFAMGAVLYLYKGF